MRETPGGDTQCKSSYGDIPQTRVAKLVSWYINDTLYKMQNLIYEWVNFSKFEPKLAQIFEKSVNLVKTWPKLVGQIGILMGHFLLKNWYMYGYTLKFLSNTSLPKPNWSTPIEKHAICTSCLMKNQV